MTDIIAGRFALAEPIASGGSAVVWRATDLRTGRECAAKVLRRRDAGEMLRFVREQSVRVSGPHVLAPYAWAAEDDHVVIASKLARGGTVAGMLGDYGPLREASVAEVLDQVLIALTHVHEAGLVHRDVKPANLLLDATGEGRVNVMLADFGLAIGAASPRLTTVGEVIGTAGYMAPESLSAATPPAPTQDVYAAGQVAVALLSGAEPTEASPVDLSGVADPTLRELITDMVAADLSRRPSAAVARQRLAGCPRERTLHTRDGDPVEVPDHIAHLLDSIEPQPTNAVRARTASTEQWRSRHDPPVQSEEPPPRPHRARRRFAFLSAAAVVVVAGVGTGTTMLLTHGSSSGSGSPPPATNAPGGGSGSPPPATRASGGGSGTSLPPATAAAVRAGGQCSWEQEGDRAATNDGRTVVCTAHGNGYVWLVR